MLKIIDVSQWQKTIKWAETKQYIDGAILRLGYGSDDPEQDDKEYAYNLAECQRLQIPVEVYIYSYAYTEAMARSEAEHALRLIKGTKIRRVWYDLEESRYGTYAKAVLSAFTDKCNANGIEVGLYTYENYYNSYLKGITAWPIWIAKYSTFAPNIGTKYVGWQYTPGAQIPGISGRVDCSHWYGAFAEAPEESKKAAQPEVYRLYRQNRHFYTTDRSEWAALVADGWTGEGVAWKAPKDGSPVYRYEKDGEHIWTMDAKERTALARDGWRKEGIAFRSGKAVPIYRLYNGSVGDRVYTRSKNEKKALVKAGWADEGIAFYGRS